MFITGPPLLTALVKISFISVGSAVAYNGRGEVQGSNPIVNIAFFRDKICTTVTHVVMLEEL